MLRSFCKYILLLGFFLLGTFKPAFADSVSVENSKHQKSYPLNTVSAISSNAHLLHILAYKDVKNVGDFLIQENVEEEEEDSEQKKYNENLKNFSNNAVCPASLSDINFEIFFKEPANSAEYEFVFSGTIPHYYLLFRVLRI